MKHRRYYWFWAFLLPIQWVFIQLLSSNPLLVENYYSNGIYLIISQIVRFLFGWIPFSFGDLFYLFLGYWLIKTVLKIIRIRRIELVRFIGTISIIYFSFHLLWGLNYLRVPLSESLQLKSTKYTTEELVEFTTELVKKVNHLQLELTKNDTIKVAIPYSKKEIYKLVPNGYQNTTILNVNTNYQFTSIKHSLLSLPLSYMGFSGYLNPFTGEAQVNSRNPLVSYPSTSCHEVAHQLGYAAENEANFIGVIAAMNNDNLYFQYSGYYLALRYAMNDLYVHDKDSYDKIVKELHRGVIKNMIESQKHWAQYRNPLEPLFKLAFNQFLKVNKQKDGIKSYNFMVGLLINFDKESHSIFRE